jgi:hypothetical protein
MVLLMLRSIFIITLLVTVSAFGADPATKAVPKPAAESKPVEKDGIAIIISTQKDKLKSDEQPEFVVRFTNTSKDYVNLYDVEAYGDWVMTFSKNLPKGAPCETWKVRFDKIASGNNLVHKQLKPGESLEVAVGLSDPLFTFGYEFAGPESKVLPRRRHLGPGDYRLELTISLKNPFGPGHHLWCGPLKTEPVDFTIANESSTTQPTEREIAAFDKAMEPTIELTREKNGLWLNGGFPEIKLPDGAEAEDVIAAAVNVNRSNLGSKGYRVLRLRQLDGETDKKAAALISVGKSTKVLIFFSLGKGKWWTRFYKADL